MSDSLDRRVLATYLEEYLGDFLFDTFQPFHFYLGRDGSSIDVPPAGPREVYIKAIEALPLVQSPEVRKVLSAVRCRLTRCACVCSLEDGGLSATSVWCAQPTLCSMMSCCTWVLTLIFLWNTSTTGLASSTDVKQECVCITLSATLHVGGCTEWSVSCFACTFLHRCLVCMQMLTSAITLPTPRSSGVTWWTCSHV